MIPTLTSTLGWRSVWFAITAVSALLIFSAIRSFSRLGLFRDSAVAAVSDDPPSILTGARSWRRVLAFVSVWMIAIWIIKFMNGFSFMSFQNFLAPLLRDNGSQSIQYSSAVWLTIAVVGAFSGFAVGRLADSLGLRRTLTLCYAMFVGSCSILYYTQSGPLPFIAAILFGLSFYPIYGLIPAYVSKISTGVQATLVFGLANVAQGAGGVVGNVTGGVVAGNVAWLPPYYLILGAGAFVLAAATFVLPSDRRSADEKSADSVGAASPIVSTRV
ncbi:MAG: MFS transporter [Nocardioides sp.]